MAVTAEQLVPLLIWLPVASLFFNFVLMVFLLMYIQRGKFKPKEQQELEHHMMSVIKQAEVRSTEIIEDATKKAHAIILEAAETKKDIEARLKKFVDDTTDSDQNQLDIEKGAILQKFKETYGRLVAQYEGDSQVLISNLQNEAREMQTSFRKSLQDESVSILKQMKENSEKQMLEANKEVREYREHAFAKIDEQMEAVVKQYIADYFTTEMTKESHENILFQALERFKKSYKNKQQS